MNEIVSLRLTTENSQQTGHFKVLWLLSEPRSIKQALLNSRFCLSYQMYSKLLLIIETCLFLLVIYLISFTSVDENNSAHNVILIQML